MKKTGRELCGARMKIWKCNKCISQGDRRPDAVRGLYGEWMLVPIYCMVLTHQRGVRAVGMGFGRWETRRKRELHAVSHLVVAVGAPSRPPYPKRNGIDYVCLLSGVVVHSVPLGWIRTPEVKGSNLGWVERRAKNPKGRSYFLGYSFVDLRKTRQKVSSF